MLVVVSAGTRQDLDSSIGEDIYDEPLVMARSVVPRIEQNSLPVVGPAVLIDYEAWDKLYQERNTHVSVELHQDYIRLKDAVPPATITREMLLKEDNAFDRYLQGLTDAQKNTIRYEIYEMGIFYLVSSIMYENDVPPMRYRAAIPEDGLQREMTKQEFELVIGQRQEEFGQGYSQAAMEAQEDGLAPSEYQDFLAESFASATEQQRSQAAGGGQPSEPGARAGERSAERDARAGERSASSGQEPRLRESLGGGQLNEDEAAVIERAIETALYEQFIGNPDYDDPTTILNGDGTAIELSRRLEGLSGEFVPNETIVIQLDGDVSPKEPQSSERPVEAIIFSHDGQNNNFPFDDVANGSRQHNNGLFFNVLDGLTDFDAINQSGQARVNDITLDELLDAIQQQTELFAERGTVRPEWQNLGSATPAPTDDTEAGPPTSPELSDDQIAALMQALKTLRDERVESGRSLMELADEQKELREVDDAMAEEVQELENLLLDQIDYIADLIETQSESYDVMDLETVQDVLGRVDEAKETLKKYANAVEAAMPSVASCPIDQFTDNARIEVAIGTPIDKVRLIGPGVASPASGGCTLRALIYPEKFLLDGTEWFPVSGDVISLGAPREDFDGGFNWIEVKITGSQGGKAIPVAKGYVWGEIVDDQIRIDADAHRVEVEGTPFVSRQVAEPVPMTRLLPIFCVSLLLLAGLYNIRARA
mmetsp:Transcript_23868/g.43216  ORF Transcript_23868/g.43216 Transcript_23868/m.43216 type:complete len:710 (+) Transcript_23868:6782-8911(+)